MFAAFAAAPAYGQRVYLNDANTNTIFANSRLQGMEHGFPRVLVHEFDSSVSNEAYSKYDFVDVSGQQMPNVEVIQSRHSPDTRMLRHISARAYQSFNYGTCVISGGIAFESTTGKSQGGPKSAGCGIYAGHWMYRVGTTTTQSISAGATTIRVSSVANITNGSYVVIYNAPAGSFKQAEHARVTNVNSSTKTITVQRGFKSSASSHPAGSIVAQHVTGQGEHAQLWAFNMSTQSPRDGNGKTFGEFYADWLGRNLLRYGNGETTSAEVAGVMFDADFFHELKPTKSDVNNDLVVDNGMGPGGTNWLGDGVDEFYRRLSSRLDGKYILAGIHSGRGFEHAHGTQMENWLDYGNGDFSPNPQYNKFDEMMGYYLFNMSERANGPPLVHNLSKTPTRLYPGSSATRPATNAAFRLAFTTTLLEDGYFGTHSVVEPDAWYDEYAVDVQPGSPDYGKAIPKNNAERVRRHREWLGQPLGPFLRLYNNDAFAPNRSMLKNGSFDSNINQWRRSNVTLARETSSEFEGNGALHISPMINYHADLNGAWVKSERLSVKRNQPYTIAFAMRSSEYRDMRVALGDATSRLPVSPRWRRYVITLTPSKTGYATLKFNVGREQTHVWLDSVYLFEGDTNVFSREFENGMVLANATSSSKTINVGSNFRRVLGSQDSVNNGNNVTSVTLPPYDGIVLVRREGAAGGGGGGGDDGGGGSGTPANGSGLIGDRVWRDENGNGRQDSGESGWAGLTVKLRECGGAVIRSTKTGTNGKYEFADLGPGDYEVEFPLPAGASFSEPGGGGTGSDVNPETRRSWCATITSAGEERRSIDAGIIPGSSASNNTKPANSSIGDYVWHDENANGIQNNSEAGLANVKVKLRDCNGIYQQTTFTDDDGKYAFGNLEEGRYLVQFLPPAGADLAPPQRGTDASADSNAGADGHSHCIDLGANDQRGGIDAGIVL